LQEIMWVVKKKRLQAPCQPSNSLKQWKLPLAMLNENVLLSIFPGPNVVLVAENDGPAAYSIVASAPCPGAIITDQEEKPCNTCC